MNGNILYLRSIVAIFPFYYLYIRSEKRTEFPSLPLVPAYQGSFAIPLLSVALLMQTKRFVTQNTGFTVNEVFFFNAPRYTSKSILSTLQKVVSVFSSSIVREDKEEL